MIVVQQLSVYRKRLTNEQLDLLLEKAESSKPLFLLTCCEELRCVGVLVAQPFALGCFSTPFAPVLCLPAPQAPSAVRLVRFWS